MMRNIASRAGTLVATLAIAVPGALHAQSIEESLGALAQDNARLYIQPITTGFGTALSTGFFQNARPHNRFGFDIGVRVMGAIVPDADKTFVPVLPASVTFQNQTYSNPYAPSDGVLSSATAAGDKGPGMRLVPAGAFRNDLLLAGENPNDYALDFPEGLDIPAVPFAILQGSLGVGFGTDLTLRLVPGVEVNEDVGEISAIGFGIKHSIDQWIPAPLPVNLAVSAGRQNFKVGDYLDASATSFALVASKGLGPLTFFGSAGRESSKLDVRYTVSNLGGNPALPADGEVITFSSDEVSGARATLGFNLKLLLLDLSAEYGRGEYQTATLKLGFSFN